MGTWRRIFGSRSFVLYGLSVGGAVAEAVALKAVGMTASLALAPQATALLPLAALHDDRWVLVFGNSWPAVGGELAASVTLRAAFTAAVVRAAWPGPPPEWRAALWRGAVAAAVSLIAMSPWATLSFVGGVVSLSYPILGGALGAALTASLLLPHAGTAPGWWARGAPWSAAAWTLVSLLLLTFWGGMADQTPGWLVVVVAAAAGASNGWCWRKVVAAAAAGRRPPRRRWVAPLATAGAVVVLVGIVGTLMAAIVHTVTPAPVRPQAAPQRGQKVVLLVDGFQSQWNGGRPALELPGFYVTEFSYRGFGRGDRPLPYGSADTERSLPVLTRRFAAQVARLRRRSGRSLDVLAVSEGTLVVRQYLADRRPHDLGTVVLGSPLPRPSRVWYPPSGRSGWGLAGGWETSMLARIVDAEKPGAGIDPAMPMVRSLEDEGPLFRQRSLCPAPGVRIVALLPLTSAVADPPGPLSGIPDGVVPAFHATLLDLRSDRRLVDRLFHGGRFPHFFGWGAAYQIARDAASAWQVPSLPLDLVGRWARSERPDWGDAAFGSYGCPAADQPSSRSP